MNMTMEQAMAERHMVRKYTDKNIPEELVEKLEERITDNNEIHHLNMKLVTNSTSAFNAVIKLILAKGVKNFIILSGTESSDLDEKLGYCGADLMIYAQTLGLNTWWVGGTFNRSVSSMVPGKKVIGVIAIGYGVTQGKMHKTKTAEEVATYEGRQPQWFIDGVNAALLAPTALNKQAFSIKGSDNKVRITCEESIFKGANIGLVKYHFELGAKKDNSIWLE